MTHPGTRETFLPCHHDATHPRVTRPGKTFPRATSSERLRSPRSRSSEEARLSTLQCRGVRGPKAYQKEGGGRREGGGRKEGGSGREPAGAAGVRGSATAISSLPPRHLPSPLLPLDVLHVDAC